MTQFPSQPAYPQYNVPPPPPIAPWSGSAIAGFILSFFGCSIIGGILGLILGIVGIFDCKGGRRRGMGLAIAAIPVALISSAFTGLVVFMFIAIGKEMIAMGESVIPAVQSADKMEAAGVIRQFTTADFNDEVSKEALAAWLSKLEEKHGRLTKLTLDQQYMVTPSQDDYAHVNFDGKFVNGSADVKVVIDMFPIRIVDFEVDSVSPRESSEKKSE